MMRLLLLNLAFAFSVQAGQPYHVNLTTVLKLAGGNHDEIAFAQARQAEAHAESKLAWQRFWPSLTLGAGYRGHEGNVQDIAGAVFNARKQQYTVAGNLMVDWSPGDLYYSALSAKQKALAAEQRSEATRRDVLLQASTRYYDLLKAEAHANLLQGDLRLTEDYEKQTSGAVTAGISLRTDFLRIKAQTHREKLAIRQAEERRDLAAAALAESLRLPAQTELRPAKADLLPVRLTEARSGVASLISRAQQQRPEMKAAQALNQAASHEKDRARIAPMIPNVQGGYSLGGLGGGFAGQTGNWDDTQDFFIGFGWKIGPGGLFDKQRQKIANARTEATLQQSQALKAAIGRQVVEAAARAQSTQDQIQLNDEAVKAAEEMVSLSQQRQAQQISTVIDYLLAREELTRARQARIDAVTSYNQAQLALQYAVGK
jgi:outer membrane protein TolC